MKYLIPAKNYVRMAQMAVGGLITAGFGYLQRASGGEAKFSNLYQNMKKSLNSYSCTERNVLFDIQACAAAIHLCASLNFIITSNIIKNKIYIVNQY